MYKDDLNLKNNESVNNGKKNYEVSCLVKDLIAKVINESDSQPYRGENINSRD